MLKVGFIGAGRRGQSIHYPCVSRLDDVSLEAVAELDGSRMETVVDKYDIPRHFSDYREMLESVELDIVYIVMGETFVTPIALDCMNAGKQVFIEKPPGANTAETQQILDAAVANDVYCMVGYQRRHAAMVQEAIKLVRDRGPATLAVAEFHKLLPSPGATSTLWNDICHIVDLVRYMVGSEATEVTAYQDSHNATWKNSYNAMIRFANDAVGIITANRSSGGRVMRVELHGIGIGCYMHIEPPPPLPHQMEIYEDLTAFSSSPRILSPTDISGTAVEDVDSYQGALAMHEDFIRCIQTGETPSTDIRDVIHTSRLVDRIEGILD